MGLAIAVLLDNDQIVRDDLAAGQKSLYPPPDLGRLGVLRHKRLPSSASSPCAGKYRSRASELSIS
jgi:hypothetical protein